MEEEDQRVMVEKDVKEKRWKRGREKSRRGEEEVEEEKVFRSRSRLPSPLLCSMLRRV